MKRVLITHHISGMGGATISFLDTVCMLKDQFALTVLIPENSSKIMVDRLSKMGVDIRFFEGEFPQCPYYSGSRGFFSRTVIGHILQVPKQQQKIVRAIEKESPDIVINNTVVQFVIGKYLQQYSFIKLLYIHETFKENGISKYMIGRINKYYDGIIGISPYEHEYAKFRKPYQVVADTYHNEQSVFCEMSNTMDRNTDCDFNVLYLGGNSLLKGFDTLAEALRYLNKSINITIAGSQGDEIDSSKKWMHPFIAYKMHKTNRILKKYRDRIQRQGFMSDPSLLIMKSDVLIFPSKKPHQPRPVMEAGYFRKTAVMSDFQQTKAFYQNGYNVVTFKPNSGRDLAEKINNLYENKDLLNDLAENNYNMTMNRHAFDNEKAKLISFIALLCERIQEKQ